MLSSTSVKMVKFNNGQQYPILGLGTWQVIENAVKLFIYLYYLYLLIHHKT